MSHTITLLSRGHDDYTYRCRCGDTSAEGFRTRQMAVDAADAHLRYIERVKVHTAGKTGTLVGDYNHAVDMATREGVSEKDRAVWRQMAGELGRRLGYGLPPWEQEELFSVEDVKGSHV